MENKNFNKFDSKVSPGLQQFLPLALVLLIIVQTFSFAIKDKMGGRIPETFDYYARCISAAVSNLKFGLNGYVGYEKVYQNLKENGFTWENHENPKALNNAIHQAVMTSDVGSNVVFMSDDVGYVNFFRTAFVVFGFTVQSFLYLYFLLFFVEVAIFYIEFRHNKLAITGLILFLLSHYIVITGLYGAGYNLWAVHNNRFLPVLGLLPIAHICLLAIFKKPLKVSTFLGACIQSLMFIFILELRSSATWMLAPIITMACFAAASKVKRWPILTIIVILLLPKLLYPQILNPGYYKQENFISHPFWFPIYLGLAISPEIREIYGPRDKVRFQYGFDVVCRQDHGDDTPRKAKTRQWLCGHPQIAKPALATWDNIRGWVSSHYEIDQDGHRATLKWLLSHGKTEEYLYNFGPDDKVGYPRWFGLCDSKEKYLQNDPSNAHLRKFDITKDFKWKEMDNIMGQVFKDAVKNHPLLVLKTIFITKPFFFFIYYILYFAKIRSIPELVLIIASYAYLIWYLKEPLQAEMKIFLVLLFVMFAFSMIVPLTAYPMPYCISEQAVLFTMCLLSLIFYFLKRKQYSKS